MYYTPIQGRRWHPEGVVRTKPKWVPPMCLCDVASQRKGEYDPVSHSTVEDCCDVAKAVQVSQPGTARGALRRLLKWDTPTRASRGCSGYETTPSDIMTDYTRGTPPRSRASGANTRFGRRRLPRWCPVDRTQRAGGRPQAQDGCPCAVPRCVNLRLAPR